MAPKPRSRQKRIAWLRRYLVVLKARLKRGFLEAWYRQKHFTVAAQERQCRTAIKAALAELEALTQ
jgi:hypothetical protein